MTTLAAEQPFQLPVGAGGTWSRRILAMVRSPLEKMLGLSRLNEKYAQVDRSADFVQEALRVLGMRYRVEEESLARVPTSGPLVIVANHPFGGIDGLVLLAALRKIRPDVKVMANAMLSRIAELRESMIFVNPFGGEKAARSNLAGLRASLAHLKGGGALIVFPAGEVSHFDFRRRAIVDPAWSETVARLVRMTKSPVLPVFFHGNNSRLFQLAGMIHPLLRTAMLPREMLARNGACAELEIGTVIPFARLGGLASDSEITAYLRLRTYILQTRKTDRPAECAAKRGGIAMEAVVAAGDPGVVMDEVLALPADAKLLESPEFAVYVANARQIPNALREIGRLREITFRATHEGTGKSIDLDAFDEDYLHLFCWNRKRNEIAGAYRLGQSDLILRARGVKGLYTRTLFRFDSKLLEQFGPALELGRSFVRAEYQKSYSPLMMLWKGIGTFVAKNPRYQVMFGPVSINNQYQSVSRDLIVRFLRQTSSSKLAKLIRATNPPRVGPIRAEYMQEYSTVVRDIDEVSDLVQEIESDRKGIPILLKQYMKLSARLLGFNVDPDFGDVLDGLIVVDFREIPEKLVERFCGRDGAAAIRDYRRQNER